MLIDKLAYSSPLRRRSPALKAGLAVGALLIAVAAQSVVVSVVTLLMMGGLAVGYGRTSFSHYRHLMLVPAAFLVLGAVAIVFQVTTVPLDLWNLPLGGEWVIGMSRQSLWQGIQLTATAFAAVSCLYFLTLTTPVTDLLNLLRRLHCPAILLELMLLIYRYLFVVLEMAQGMLTAQRCRLGNRNVSTKMRGMGEMLSVLLVRSLARSSRLYDAMESRLYDGRIQVLSTVQPAKAWEKAAVLLLLAGLGALALIVGKGGLFG